MFEPTQQPEVVASALNKEQSIGLVYMGLSLCTDQYGLSKYFASRLLRFIKASDNWEIVPAMLAHWDCFEESGRMDLSRLADPTYVRPCGTLFEIYQQYPKPNPDPVFKEIDPDPGFNEQMVYTYRVVFDAIFALKLPFYESDDAYHFVENAVIFQLDKEFLHNK